MSLKRPINALIIDDKQEYMDSLKGTAQAKRIILETKTNLIDGIDYLKNNKSIEFVILDGKCFVDKENEMSGSTISNMPIRAQKMIDDINRNDNRQIFYCVNTGFSDELGASFESVFEVFKKDDSAMLFDHIIERVSNSAAYKLKNQYNEFFEVFDYNFIDKKYHHLLVELLNCLEKKEYKKKNLNVQRDLLEASFNGLKNLGCFPSNLFHTDGRPNLEHCTMFMENRPVKIFDYTGSIIATETLSHTIPKNISAIIRKLKESTSEYSHLSADDMLKNPFLANTYCLLEYFAWLKDFCLKNYPTT
jgi:hypothetical protein